MCRPVTCKTCQGVTWSGCGNHVDAVMRNVPREARCICDPAAPRPGLLERLFGGRA